jgi:hypothetical protein
MLGLKPFGVLVLTSALATSALASVDTIMSIDVTNDLSAIENADAAAYWANLEKDLEAAIGLRVQDRLAEAGAEIKIDIREIELANAFERELNLGDAVLVGMVNIVDQTENDNFDTYELTVSLENAKVVLAEGETLVLSSTDTPETYQRLVDVFADGVVSRLK